MNLEYFGGAAIAALTSLIACRALIATGPIDAPNLARKAHRAPTPTSGGVAIALGFAVGLMALSLTSHVVREDMTARGVVLLTFAVTFAYAFLVIGFVDDAHPLSAKLKFALFTVASLGAGASIGAVQTIPAGAMIIALPLWLGLLGTGLWIFTLVNCVNFMDGANGLAMGTVAIGMGALGLIAYAHGSSAGVAIGLCAVGALIGFLYWNFPHGRLFAGDSGALFTGALAALASLLVIHRTGLSPLIPPILFFPILADALITLVWRAIRRRSLFDGHSEHVYQIAVHAGMSHAEIAMIYWAVAGVCGAVGVILSYGADMAPLIALLAMTGSAVLVSTMVRRFAGRRGVGGV